MSVSDSESQDSLEMINNYEENETQEEDEYIQNVRNAVKDWKTREMEKSSEKSQSAKGLQNLRSFVTNSARLYYDINGYLDTNTNNESNMKDELYRNIIDAIGAPASLTSSLKLILQHFLERDLIELPFTIEPKVVNTYAHKGMKLNTNFPDEE